MRRLLAAVDADLPKAVPVDEHIQEPGKVRAAGGVTEVEPIQRLLRAAAPPGARPESAPGSDQVWNASSAPSWLGEPLLQPGERVVLWGGPRFGRLLGWLRRGVGHLIVKGQLGILLVVGIAAVVGLPLAGMRLDRLLGWTDVGPPFICCSLLALGYVFGTLGFLVWAESDVFYVLTDRRLLVLRNYKLVQAFEFDLMRRLLAAIDAAPPAGSPADEHLVDPSKVRPTEGVTEMSSIFHMLRAFGQVQVPVSK
jgi:hypothetical protein